MTDPIQDAHERGLISYHHEDLIAEMLRDKRNWQRISLALACSTLAEPFDRLDMAIRNKEPMN